MSFPPRRTHRAAQAQARTTVETSRPGGVSTQDFYRGIFDDPRAAMKTTEQDLPPEDAMVRFYRELNAKPTRSNADGKQKKDVLMVANDAGQDVGRNTTNSTLVYPTADPYVTSPYGKRRHPVTGEEHFHSATDYRNKKGSPVFSSRDGKVIAKGKDSKGTHFVKIRDKDGIVFGYFHNGSDLNIGNAVNMGDVVGYSDDSGLATAPHLHLTIEPDGTRASRVDPDKFLRNNTAGKTR